MHDKIYAFYSSHEGNLHIGCSHVPLAPASKPLHLLAHSLDLCRNVGPRPRRGVSCNYASPTPRGRTNVIRLVTSSRTRGDAPRRLAPAVANCPHTIIYSFVSVHVDYLVYIRIIHIQRQTYNVRRAPAGDGMIARPPAAPSTTK